MHVSGCLLTLCFVWFGTLAVMFLIGYGFELVPALQVPLMNVAGEAQTLAAALKHRAFNISNTVNASLDGLSIAGGLDWALTLGSCRELQGLS